MTPVPRSTSPMRSPVSAADGLQAARSLMRSASQCFSFSSWFCVPSQGMRDFEILCRASAFIVPAKNKEKYSHHVLTVSHAAAPWRWPKLYSDDWLQFVNETHCMYTAERDLAVLHFEESTALDFFATLGVKTNWSLMPRELGPLPGGQPLVFHGHEVMDRDLFADQNDDKLVVPLDVEGSVYARTQHQVFCKTRAVLPLGMCGGPVVTQLQGRNVVVGLLEGIVPTTHPEERIRNNAVFAEAADIEAFLDQIEREEVEPLQSGLSSLVVGFDQDPEKMDLNRVL